MRKLVLAGAFVLVCAATPAMAQSFDGAWKGKGALAGTTRCPQVADAEGEIRNNLLQGKIVYGAFTLIMSGPIRADGVIEGNNVRGKFNGNSFSGTVQSPIGVRCEYAVTMTKG